MTAKSSSTSAASAPREPRPRACYVLFDGDEIIWRRVSGDIEAVLQQYRDLGVLDESLANG